MSIINLTPAQLRHAADLKEKIEHLQNELGQIQGVKAAAVSVPASKPARKKISAAGIARIRAAQKARWAKIKGAAKPVAAPAPYIVDVISGGKRENKSFPNPQVTTGESNGQPAQKQ